MIQRVAIFIAKGHGNVPIHLMVLPRVADYVWTSPRPRPVIRPKMEHTETPEARGRFILIHAAYQDDLGGPGTRTVDGWNPANQLRLVVYPIIFTVSYIPGIAGVSHQQ